VIEVESQNENQLWAFMDESGRPKDQGARVRSTLNKNDLPDAN